MAIEPKGVRILFKSITIHFPFADISLFTYNEFVKKEVVRQTGKSIEATSFLGGFGDNVFYKSLSFVL